ncbi:hypothetical protein [Pedobacter sp. V48]|uniref:hypothetical protein n=1 Tax=Pedobacter sp. V48 TaxID=509635 RepID=UPI0003E5868F|nr:hypothetical protein [Pedobacter sp. V48]ETZ21796.1 hypothetical protein N824_26530 [Pedobacter sp. V48]
MEEQENNPLTNAERIIAGIILVFFTSLALLIVIAYWPDKLQNNRNYQFKAFHVKLIGDSCIKDVKLTEDCLNAAIKNKAIVEKLKLEDINAKKAEEAAKLALDKQKGQPEDSLTKFKEDLANAIKKSKDASDKLAAQKELTDCVISKCTDETGSIQLNSLILILVAAAGFLGNMIYIAKSFTAFIGVRKFNRSWILWYFVKPFTAAALAVIFYLAINDFSDGSAKAINLNLIIAMAALTGLFTDIAMSKLKDIFEVIIKPNKDPILAHDPAMKIHQKNIKPEKIDVLHPNEITIPGVNLDPKNLIVKMNGQAVTDLVITSSLIKFTYTVASEDKEKTEFNLVVTDKSGKELTNLKLGI